MVACLTPQERRNISSDDDLFRTLSHKESLPLEIREYNKGISDGIRKCLRRLGIDMHGWLQ